MTADADDFRPQHVEIRGEIAREDVETIDACVQAEPGSSRMSLLRHIVREWCAKKRHEASLVMRVTASNGIMSDADRNPTGSGRGRR